MLVCTSCFKDEELIAFISSKGIENDCNVCDSGNVRVIDLEELYDFFQELLINFELNERGSTLKSLIQSNWSFFSSDEIAAKILNIVIKKVDTSIINSESKVDFISEIKENINYWFTLKQELKGSRRFLSDINYLVQDLGWDSYFNSQFNLESDKIYYRARVHHKSELPPYPVKEMGCPTPTSTRGGRANPLGIPFLYLSDNEETVLYEVRASFLDEISVGMFRVENNIEVKIVDFTERISIYNPGNVNGLIKAHLLKRIISEDLSKPMRRYDSEIEYIPTQFICEFIKIITNAKGIQFKSSLHPKGNNLVIFDESLMKCTNVILKKITLLNIESEEIEK